MDPLTVFSLYDALSSEHLTVFAEISQFLKAFLDEVRVEFLCGLIAEGIEDFISVVMTFVAMMVVMMVVAAALGIIALFLVMILVVMVMVFVFIIIIVIMVMMVFMFVLILIVVVMVFMFVLILVMVVVIMVMVMMVLMLMESVLLAVSLHFFHQFLFKRLAGFHVL